MLIVTHHLQVGGKYFEVLTGKENCQEQDLLPARAARMGWSLLGLPPSWSLLGLQPPASSLQPSALSACQAWGSGGRWSPAVQVDSQEKEWRSSAGRQSLAVSLIAVSTVLWNFQRKRICVLNWIADWQLSRMAHFVVANTESWSRKAPHRWQVLFLFLTHCWLFTVSFGACFY